MMSRRAAPPWSPLRWTLILLAAVLCYGTLGYMAVADFSFVDSFYMTVITLSTVGFLEVEPLDTAGRLFTVSLIAMGVTLVLLALGLAARTIAEERLGGRARRRRMQKRIDALRDHYIICAYGRVGRTVAREFEAEGETFVVIEALDDLEEQMIQDGVLYIRAAPDAEDVLLRAGVERAKGLVCAVDSDASNVYITLAARSLNPNVFIVTRSAAHASAEHLYRAGADRVVSPYVSSGRHMALLARRPRILDYLEVTSPDMPSLLLEELLIEGGSDLVGRPVGEIAGDALTLAIRKATGDIIQAPPPGYCVEAGDLLVLLGEKDALHLVDE